MIYDSILDTIGRTPVVRINRLAPPGVEMYVKIEAFNPMSSVKDRLAIAIILDAEQKGQLKPGQFVVEATSGNTGIALAMVCAAKGYPFVAFMVETFSIERRKLMRAFGAKVTPHMFIIDPAGTVIYAGAIDDRRSANPADVKTANNYVAAAFGDVRSGKPVATANSSAYGCTIKY